MTTRRMTTRLTIKAAIVATMLGLAACGTSSPTVKPVDTASTTSTASAADKEAVKQQYIADASAICSRMSAEALALMNELVPTGRAENPAQAVAYYEALQPLNDTMLAELRALVPPPGDEDRLEAIYNELESFEQTRLDIIDAINAQSQAIFDSRLAQARTEIARFDAQLDGYGLTVCGSEATAKGEQWVAERLG